MPYFHDVVAQHPKMLRGRPDLSFARDSAPRVVADQWRRSGVVLLREVLSPEMLAGCRQVFNQFIESEIKKSADTQVPANDSPPTLDEGPRPEWADGETIHGSWHVPWIIRHGGQAPTSTVLSELITSWAWPVIEEICDSKDIVVMLGLCLGRHNIDQPLLVGAHQDATAVNPEVPLSIWIPLQEVAPLRDSGLGFIVPAPDHVLPAEPNNDVGSSYFMNQLGKMWIPHYQAGDLTIHSKLSPHFTTGYGTMNDRFSLEIRLWARDDAFLKYYDPSIRVGRLNGIPVITETKCTPGVRAHGFVASTAILAMQTISAMPPPKEIRESEQSPPQGLMATLRDAARRLVPGANR